MGFDVFGAAPISNEPVPVRPDYDTAEEKELKVYYEACSEYDVKNFGRYFRNNVWWWRPLWDYVCEEVAPNVLNEEDKERGCYNDGHLITAIKAMYIADKIDELDRAGELVKYEKQHNDGLEALPLEVCDLCEGTGTRDDEHVRGECNACHGKGEKKSFMTHYPFEANNVREFGRFAKFSGGFTIY